MVSKKTNPKKSPTVPARHHFMFRSRKTLIQKLDQIIKNTDADIKGHYIDRPFDAPSSFKSRTHLINYILENWLRDYEERKGIVNVKIDN